MGSLGEAGSGSGLEGRQQAPAARQVAKPDSSASVGDCDQAPLYYSSGSCYEDINSAGILPRDFDFGLGFGFGNGFGPMSKNSHGLAKDVSAHGSSLKCTS